MEREIIIGGVYRHFKGNSYKVLTVAEDSETGETVVTYKRESDGRVYVRPLEMFMSEVDHEKYPDVSQRYRFELIGAERMAMVTIESEDNIYLKVSDVVHIDRLPETVKALIDRFVHSVKILDNGLPASGFIGESGCKITGIFKYGELGFISYVGREEDLVTGQLIHIFSNVTEEEYNKMKEYADAQLSAMEDEGGNEDA